MYKTSNLARKIFFVACDFLSLRAEESEKDRQREREREREKESAGGGGYREGWAGVHSLRCVGLGCVALLFGAVR